jgi:hypothetical protein
MQQWCILRVAASRTLKLADGLEECGFRVWIPREMRLMRFGKKRELIERPVPILPEFVFADFAELGAMRNLSHGLPFKVWDETGRRMRTHHLPAFSIFQLHGRVARETDDSLAPLRAIETSLGIANDRRRNRKDGPSTPPQFKAGEQVFTDANGFVGIKLTVSEDSTGKIVKVFHKDWSMPLEISAWNLRRIVVSENEPKGFLRVADWGIAGSSRRHFLADREGHSDLAAIGSIA